MLLWNYLRDPILLFAVLTFFCPLQSAAWRDPSPHTTKFVPVEKNIRLEVLDWGGRGRPVILLAGGGNTAHVFDEFAPKLATNCRVYAITRRGFGASSYAPPKPGADRFGADILAVVRALKINKPVLVGHSIAGVELSSAATLDAKRIRGVVYLEAAYPYAFDNGTGPSMQAFQDLSGPRTPSPTESDLRSFAALDKWDAEVYGFRLPESEFRQTWDSTPDGRVIGPRNFPGSQYVTAMMTNTRKYAKIPVPSLAIFAIPHLQEAWISRSTDPDVQKKADVYFANIDLLAEKQAKTFERGVPGARVIRQRGTHYIFLSSTSDVLREIRAFVSSLQ
ncbi:MAG: alpha/beta hydrolase [Acidobacteria bacterium]|nr:alpha/beta hydrolase [Acidobacteriota bacterium]